MKAKAPKNKDVLSKAQIYRRYPSEWVLIEDPVSDKHLQLLRGRVIFHSKDRDEMSRELLRVRPYHFAVEYTGKPPKGMEFVL